MIIIIIEIASEASFIFLSESTENIVHKTKLKMKTVKTPEFQSNSAISRFSRVFFISLPGRYYPSIVSLLIIIMNYVV